MNDTHTATIDWGDGTIELGAVDETSGSGTIAGSHGVTVTVTDKDGSSDTSGFSVEVAAVPELVLEDLGEAVSASDLPKGTINILDAGPAPLPSI